MSVCYVARRVRGIHAMITLLSYVYFMCPLSVDTYIPYLRKPIDYN